MSGSYPSTSSKSTSPSSSVHLATPVQYIKGVGPHRAETLAKIGIRTLEDLIFYFPRDHQNRYPVFIRDAQIGIKSAIRGEVLTVDIRQAGPRLGQAKITFRDNSGVMEGVWFKHLSYKYDVFSGIRQQVQPGRWISVYGAVELGPRGKNIRIDDYETADNSDGLTARGAIVPVYPLTEGIGDRWLRLLIERAVLEHTREISDPMPDIIKKEMKLMDLQESIRLFHFPKTFEERDRARERLAFDEFFYLELALAINRQNRESTQKGFQAFPSKTLLSPFRNQLGFEFTKAQARAINEVFQDMGRDRPMNRLLQGDVGSGKTVVALSAALLSIENGRPASFLAPTEILAEQHYLTIRKFFDSLNLKSELLTGSTKAADRKKLIERLKSGKVNILIGTHALLQEDVQLPNHGLVIIDEQHRFGVRQRAKLLEKAQTANKSTGLWSQELTPDILIMTATPIPRTLAMTLYGDLDVSMINELPKNRSPIHTEMAHESTAVRKAQKAIQEGRQVYIVFPLVNESESLTQRSGKNVRAVNAEFDRIRQLFPGVSAGLLHGQMKGEEKKKIMDGFRQGKISLLLATPVIEVGIDVPNATVMIIFNPERFGLAQLHQLRGRVGRGPYPSSCYLVGEDLQQKSTDRLSIFCQINDGFKLAEEDLKLRGAGELLGEAQHGVPMFRVGNLISDNWLIVQARNLAGQLVQGNTPLTMREFSQLNSILIRRFGHKLKLSMVG